MSASEVMTLPLPIIRDVDRHGTAWAIGSIKEVNKLLARAHYLGPIAGGALILSGYSQAGDLVAAQVWRRPTSRRLPSDGSWLELSRWCLTPDAGENAGSRPDRAAVRQIRLAFPQATTLVSYSDPSVGHTGALYRACNWRWAPTWLRLRPPPSGNGDWGKKKRQSPKDRWVFEISADEQRADLLAVNDRGAIRHWLRNSTGREVAWALASPAADLRVAAEMERAA